MVLPCLMGAFNSIGGSCFGWVGERIKTEAAHLIHYNANVENLRTQVQNLSDAIKSVEDRIQEAENNRGATLVDAVVVRLLERMASLKEEASKLTRDEEREADSRCLMGLRPNLWACYVISKSAKKAIDEAAELLEQEKKLDRAVANVDYSKSLGVTPIPDFEEFQSRVLVSNQIVAALKDPSVNTVGVYGMSGAGKTTLAEKIGADLQLDRTFSYVVLATVSEKQSLLQNNYQSDLTSIQKQIAGGLKIQLQGETRTERATQLREQLEKKDKVLIILDDIWSRIELKDVGIPIGSVHKKFKILMTSRSQMVLRKEMDSTNNFGLDSLPFDDAWNLFDRMVGGDSEYSNWRPTAEQVVKQCGGIPILLVTIARALRNEDSKTWEEALTQLKQFDGEDVVKDAYKMIEVSYKFLKSEEMKKLLLLCAQLDHRSIPMEDLLKYAMGLDLFKGCKKVKEVSGRLHKYLRDLKGCCLLQDGNKEGIIKMHDVVHKFASSVASRDHHVFSVADGELQEWPSKDELEHFSAISLPYCHLPPDHMLPATFDNPKLESFLMLRSEIDASFKIPENFFVGIKGLKLMDLTRMSLSTVLVSSLSALVKLRTLCLDHCELSDITVIGELPMLQALSLIGSSIVRVPKEIGKLGSTLKLLDLRDCLKLETIASGVISRLTLLEDLRIGDSFTTWERLEGSDKSSNSADETYEAKVTSLEEFKNLRNLINLEIHIREHAKVFPKDLVFKNLETFRIFIGRYHDYGDSHILPRTLEVKEFSNVVEFDNEGTKALMTRAESLWLERVQSSVSVSEMDPKGFPELKHLRVEFGDEIQYIVKKNYNNCIFPKLETLDLWFLEKLERICDDHDHPRQVGSFENLRVIKVSCCNLLNDLLSSNLARSLLRLKEIRVGECMSMESIIVSSDSENEEEITIGFTHQLRVLKLYDIPRLLSFYSFKQLEGLPSPTSFFNKKIVFPKLEELDLSWMKIEKIWDDHLAIAAEGICWFQNLTRLKVDNCEKLTYLFTFSMVKSFAQLKKLEINYCESIEEIVATRKGEMEGERLLLFPKLEYLELYSLPKLNFFCHANLLECQSLQELEITKFLLLNTFIGTNDSTPDIGANSTTLFDEKVVNTIESDTVALLLKLSKIVFPKLKELRLTKIKVEKIWDDESAISAGRSCWLQNLTSLNVYECNNLSYLFTSSMVKSLAKLKQLQVDNCESIEEIVTSTEREMAGEIQLSFPKLDNLKLNYLPNLKRFCHANLLECQLLRELLIRNCLKLKTFISSNDSSPDNSTTLFSEKVAFPNMEKLKIYATGTFKMICGNQLHPNSFSRLKILKIDYVRDLLNAFTPSMWRRALDLEKLEIAGCYSLEKVFDVQILPMNERETCRILPFQNLRSVLLSECPTLTSIFPTSLVPTLQQLERLEVRNCDKIDLFGFNNTQRLNDAFAAFAKVISSLKYCYLESGGMIVKYEHNAILNIWELKIDGCNNIICSPILFALLQSFPKLDEVVVSSCSIIQQFPCEPDHLVADDGDDMDTQAKTLARIQHLKLTKLSNMKHILSEHSPLKYHRIPRDPKILEVVECDSLLSLAPPSTTLFKNLTRLVVRRCPMLIKLVASSSTAKNLVNLKEMSVRECDSLEEIVVIDDQWDELASNDECIVFEKLEVLELQYLNSLASFCSTSDCNFRFPSLNRVIVKNCPEMKFFSKGTLSTPKLIRVWPFWVEEIKENQARHSRWEGDLNSTIRQLFEEMVKEEEEEEYEDEDGDDDGDEHEDENEDEEV